MNLPRQSWQLLLFVGAILVPSALLVVVSSRIVEQSRELRQKRRQDEERAVLDRGARQLLAQLEKLGREAARQMAPPKGSPVVLVAAVGEDRLILPWENDPEVQRFRQQIAAPDFKARLSRGEREEFAGGRPQKAAELYRDALAAAATPAQTAHARLLLGRALLKLGRREEAGAQFHLLLKAPGGLVDEDGTPLRLHAAEHLVELGRGREEAVQAVADLLKERAWFSPGACFNLSNLASRLRRAGTEPAEIREAVDGWLRRSQQADLLQNDAGRLGLLAKAEGARVWQLYGEVPWLVSNLADPSPVVVAVEASGVLKAAEERGGFRLLAAGEPGGESLGPAFPGLRAAFPARPARSGESEWQSRMYFASLALLIGANVFGAYLLWRSLHREMQVAEIRSQFVSAVSHELKTPLTAIRMYAETLQMGRGQDPAMAGEYLSTIVGECERLSRLVENVLLFSKAEQGRKVYRFRPVSLAEAAGAAARTISYLLAAHGFELRTSFDDGVPMVLADRDAIEQAVWNLLTNAMKYSGDSRRIDLRLLRSNGDALIRVSDYGLGIANEQQRRIFEKYYRAPTRENQAIPGAGLGLSLVDQIMRAHGGRVDLESAPGKGSTFTLRLPIRTGSES